MVARLFFGLKVSVMYFVIYDVPRWALGCCLFLDSLAFPLGW